MINTTFTILAYRAPEARKQVKKMLNKARRYGVPLSIEFGAKRIDERISPTSNRKVNVEVVEVHVKGETPVVGEHKFLARVEVLEGGNIVDTIPGETANMAWRQVDGHCDHCGTNRRRKHVYIVREINTGNVVQVGRGCLRDYLGIDNPEHVMQKFDFWRSVRNMDEDFSGWSGVKWSKEIRTLHAWTLAAIRAWGWVSKGMTHDRDDLVSTASRILSMCVKDSRSPEVRAVINNYLRDEDYDTADQIIAWVRESEDTSDYMHNLKVVHREDMLWDDRRIGLAISAVASWQRATGRAEKRRQEAQESRWMGSEGERLRGLKVTLEHVRGLGDNGWGWTELFKFRTEDGAVVTWITGSAPEIEPGMKYQLSGTVKKHKEYKGIKETQITRVKVVAQQAETAS